MFDTCYITEDASGFTLNFHDGSAAIPGQATYADAARLAHRNGYSLTPPPEQTAQVAVSLRGQPAFRCSGTAGFVAEQLRQFCLQHGLR